MKQFILIVTIAVVPTLHYGTAMAANCTDGDLRLSGDQNRNQTSKHEGRVEICVNGTWGTVCDSDIRKVTAAVICRQLGFSHIGAEVKLRAYYGQGSGKIHLSKVKCIGCEEKLINCTARTKFILCEHWRDAGVKCLQASTYNCSDGDIRLQGGTSELEGRVEICHIGMWSRVCGGDSWESKEANIVCRQLGFRDFGAIALGGVFPIGNGSGLTFLECSGSEGGLNCNERCKDGCSDAGVKCLHTVPQIFLPFGVDVGDDGTNVTDITSVGPFSLRTPIVYYRHEEHELTITTNGSILFHQSDKPFAPMINPLGLRRALTHNSLWNNQSRAVLYYRITEEQSTLDRVKQMIVDKNRDQELSNFQPTLAAVITWANVLLFQQELFQVILSTDGNASFAAFIYSNVQPNVSDGLIGFDAGDGLKNTTILVSDSPMKQAHIFRIDGRCVTSVLPDDVCALETVATEYDVTSSAAINNSSSGDYGTTTTATTTTTEVSMSNGITRGTPYKDTTTTSKIIGITRNHSGGGRCATFGAGISTIILLLWLLF